jgi:diketogulonate reductase-like aldo/keto reductase
MENSFPACFQGIPDIIYGTAFKFEQSASLVKAALNAGFRAIDTAGSLSAYREALVGKGIAAALDAGICERRDLYVRTLSGICRLGGLFVDEDDICSD